MTGRSNYTHLTYLCKLAFGFCYKLWNCILWYNNFKCTPCDKRHSDPNHKYKKAREKPLETGRGDKKKTAYKSCTSTYWRRGWESWDIGKSHSRLNHHILSWNEVGGCYLFKPLGTSLEQSLSFCFPVSVLDPPVSFWKERKFSFFPSNEKKSL